ncbi:MAG: bifunctional hydroxymethylpyrimidine kinase/phosphomethylpyrimidine kinase [Thermoplasmatota archaeon]
MVPTVLSVAGSDSSGGAGIQADVKAFHTAGVHGASALTAVTAQNTRGVASILPLPVEVVEEQITAVRDDCRVTAAKTGMLYSAEIARRVADLLEDVPLVVDPVMVSTTRYALAGDDLKQALIDDLLPLAAVVTPNLEEAATLTGTEIATLEDIHDACRILHDRGASHVLVTGGHLEEPTDVLFDGHQFHHFTLPRLDRAAHGSGCTLSAYIAAFLAQGHETRESVRRAKQYTWAAIRQAVTPGKGVDVVRQADHPLPVLNGERTRVWHELQTALDDLGSILPPFLLPEVGINMAYALPGAAGPQQVCAIRGRMVYAGRPVQVGQCRFGVSRHVAAIVLAAMQHDPAKRAAANIAYRPEHVDACREAGLTVGHFDRAEEPESVSTMEWGTDRAIRSLGQVPDVIWDGGGMGKEAMIRVLGDHPGQVVDKVREIVQRLTRMEKD